MLLKTVLVCLIGTRFILPTTCVPAPPHDKAGQVATLHVPRYIPKKKPPPLGDLAKSVGIQQGTCRKDAYMGSSKGNRRQVCHVQTRKYVGIWKTFNLKCHTNALCLENGDLCIVWLNDQGRANPYSALCSTKEYENLVKTGVLKPTKQQESAFRGVMNDPTGHIRGQPIAT